MDDLISRQAAIDAIACDITVTGRNNAEVVARTIGTFADRIKALPPAQQWIPCSERPPKVRERVLACKKDGSMLVMRCIDEGHLTWFYHDVIAWMPCPEPYREENKDENHIH